MNSSEMMAKVDTPKFSTSDVVAMSEISRLTKERDTAREGLRSALKGFQYIDMLEDQPGDLAKAISVACQYVEYLEKVLRSC